MVHANNKAREQQSSAGIMCLLSTMNKVVPMVQRFHQSRANGKWTKALTISLLKHLYDDYKEANNKELLSLRNLVVNIVNHICKHIGASDTEGRSLFYHLWLKVVHDMTLGATEQQTLDNIVGFIGELQYKYQVIFETSGKYYHLQEYTFTKGSDNDNNTDAMSMVAFVQDMQDAENVYGETFTTSDVSPKSLLDFSNFLIDKFGCSATRNDMAMSLQFVMVPTSSQRAYRSLTRYLKQKTILDYLVHSIEF